jgi:hypothetical protein
MTPQQLWERGTLLRNAALEFSSSTKKNRFQTIRRPRKAASHGRDMQMLLSQMGAEGKDAAAFERDVAKFSRAFEHLKRGADLVTKMEDELLRRLSKNELIAVGYEKNADLQAGAIIIPARFLVRRFMDFQRGTVSAPPHRFWSVKITWPPAELVAARRQKAGRPTKRNPKTRANPPA